MTSLPITLPEGFTPVVVKDDQIVPGQTIATKEASQNDSLNIFEGLGVNRAQARRALRVSPGDQIRVGDIVAVKKNIFGKILKKIVSQINATIIRYERDTGNLFYQIGGNIPPEVISPVVGTVVLCNNKEIVVQTEGALVSSGVSLGTSAQGDLLILPETFVDGADNTVYYLDSRATNKIVIVKAITRDLVAKSTTIGTLGLVGLQISDNDIVYFEEKKVDLPILEINDTLLTSLRKWEHKKVYVDVPNKAIVLL